MFQRLREVRKAKGVSALEISEMLGYKTVSTYYRKEAGTIKFSLKEAKKVANRLELPIEDIFFDKAVSYKET